MRGRELFVWQVITPTLHHFPVPYIRKTVVHVIRISDGFSTRDSSDPGGFNFEAPACLPACLPAS